MSTETTDAMVERIRKMRALLPLPEGLVEAMRRSLPPPGATDSDATDADAEPMALAMRAFGYRWPLASAEDYEHGDRVVESLKKDLRLSLVLARAALAFGPQYVVHTLHPAAVRTALDTDLTFWPSAAPRALQRPLLVRALPGKGTGCLFSEIESILLLPEDASGWTHLAIGVRGVGIAVDRIQIAWSKEDVADQTEAILQTDLGEAMRLHVDGEPHINRLAVLRFLVTLGLFLEAESQSGRRVTEVRTEAGTLPDGRKPKTGQGYTVRHVRISDEALATPARKPGEASREAPPHPEGLVAESITVRGFLRRQPCGPGGRDRKVIFVAPHQRQQWVSAEREVRVR